VLADKVTNNVEHSVIEKFGLELLKLIITRHSLPLHFDGPAACENGKLPGKIV
jgi:hypothetical protein